MEQRAARAVQDLVPPPAVASLLRRGESVVAIRRNATWASPPCTAADENALRADVYLTTQRLLLIGDAIAEFPIDEITEVGLSQALLLVALRGGVGISLRVELPAVFRMNIASIRRAARAGRRAKVPTR